MSYFSVKDNTLGIVDYEKAEQPAFDNMIYTYQDGIWITFDIGDSLSLFADRGGRFLATTPEKHFHLSFADSTATPAG